MNKIMVLILAVLLTACSGVNTENKELEMPPIVFMEVVSYGDVSEEYKVKSATGFYDNKGNYYTIDRYMYSYYDKNKNKNDIFEKYEKGELDKDIKFQQKCDINELKEIYKKLYKLPKKDKIKIVYPNKIPEVQTKSVKYYGFYYDRNKNIKSVCLGEFDKTFKDTNNEQANEIYAWYEESLKENYLDKMYKKDNKY